ncbi:UNVERIFIED_CONTAM: hypothetical protein Sradi_7091000 [Sesamum radiatum]|uniref:Uncharacterized protein n=1 Tax=Sesamum radiatum TaxID=300843 RepID=A0AAW2J2R7_SESRA
MKDDHRRYFTCSTGQSYSTTDIQRAHHPTQVLGKMCLHFVSGSLDLLNVPKWRRGLTAIPLGGFFKRHPLSINVVDASSCFKPARLSPSVQGVDDVSKYSACGENYPPPEHSDNLKLEPLCTANTHSQCQEMCSH